MMGSLSIFNLFPGASKTEGPGSITHIADGTVLAGDLVSEAPIYFFGSIAGDIRSSGDVYIGDQAEVHGDVVSPNLYLAGKVMGNIDCSNYIFLKSNCAVLGNLSCSEINIERGALVAGFLTVASDKISELRTHFLKRKSLSELKADIHQITPAEVKPFMPAVVIKEHPAIAANILQDEFTSETVRISLAVNETILDIENEPVREQFVRVPGLKKQTQSGQPNKSGTENKEDFLQSIW